MLPPSDNRLNYLLSFFLFNAGLHLKPAIGKTEVDLQYNGLRLKAMIGENYTTSMGSKPFKKLVFITW